MPVEGFADDWEEEDDEDEEDEVTRGGKLLGRNIDEDPMLMPPMLDDTAATSLRGCVALGVVDVDVVDVFGALDFAFGALMEGGLGLSSICYSLMCCSMGCRCGSKKIEPKKCFVRW